MHRLQPLTEDLLRATLKNDMRRSSQLRSIHRLHAVLLVSLGHSCYEVAHWFGEDPRSIERWVNAYGFHGAKGLQDQQRTGRPARLTPQQSQQLKLELSQHEPGAFGWSQTYWSGKLLVRHLERDYGVALSLRQCQHMLQCARR